MAKHREEFIFAAVLFFQLERATLDLLFQEAPLANIMKYQYGADDDTHDELGNMRLHSVTLTAVCGCVGQTLADQALHAVGVSVASVRRASGAVTRPEDHLMLAVGDTLVLSGLPEPLARAEDKLLSRG